MTAPERRPAAEGDDAPSAPTVVPTPTVGELVDRLRATWRAALAERGGRSALADVDLLGEAQLDLTAAHPSGVAQLFAGRPTRLSNLVREGSALSAAKRRARAVGTLADEHAQRHGIAAAFLAIGVATWTEPAPEDAKDAPDGASDEVADGAAEGLRRHGPVLLRPVAVNPRGRGETDVDLVLEPSLEVNPVLAGALRSRGALLDPHALARGAFTGAGFDPKPALERLAALGAAVLDDFRLDERIVVGTFVHPEQALVADLEALPLVDHEVVAALAGDARSADALRHPLPAAVRGDRPLDQERGVGDLTPSQVHVLDAVAAGHHLLLDAPPGSDVAGTLAALVADAAAAGRTVLYVPGHRRAARAFADRLTSLGLEELLLDIAPDSGWRAAAARRLLGAMTVEPVEVDGEKVAIVQRELLDRRRRLSGYMDGLHVVRERWGTSAYDALQSLARLTSVRPAPQTRVRLSPAVAESLTAERRAQAAADLVRVAGLGAFAASVRQNPWYGADLPTPDRAATALARIGRLLDDRLPRQEAEVARVADETGLVRAATPAQWAEQLAVLDGIREALDVFQPLVFERSAADMVAATAPRAWREARGITLSGGQRRRLQRQAKDMVRPGRPVADLHAALLDVQARREVWQQHCPAGGWPRIPDGLLDLEHAAAEMIEDLTALGAVLAGTAAGGDLMALTWTELADRLERLRADAAALDTLPERTALLGALRRQGLGGLVDDLEARHVPATVVAAELDLAWWSTVLEQVLAVDPALAGYDGAALARLVAEFRTLDRRYLQDRALLHRAAIREDRRTRLRAADEETQALFAEIVEDRFTSLRHAVERYPAVTRCLRPVLVAAPMLVPQLLPPRRSEDLVVLDAAGHLPLEVVAASLGRGRQVVVVGDLRCATGSAVRELATVLPVMGLPAEPSRRDPRLTDLLAEHGYGDRLLRAPLPAPAALLRLDRVEGTGMPDAHGVVEGTAAEVAHVVELVVDHVLTRPEESLAVVTVSRVHAERVREAVRAEVRDNPALVGAFRADRAEPFVVVDLLDAEGVSRDAVVLSPGYGRTPHGRVLHQFGPLSEPGGDVRLVEVLGGVRRRLTVVSCFRPDELDADRLRAPGAHLLAELLTLAAQDGTEGDGRRPAPHAGGPDPDRLVLDLAERVWRLGLSVELDHGTDDGRIPLAVGHPDLPDEMLVAVLTDDAAYVGEPSVRVRDRQLPERLERLGWTVVQVWSAAAFLDPQGEAHAVCDAVVEARARRRAEEEARHPSLRPPTLPADDEGVEDALDAAAAAGVAEAEAADASREAERVEAAEAAEPPEDPVPAKASDPPVRRTGRVPVRVSALAHDDPTMDPLFEVPVDRPRPARPDVPAGLPVAAYTDDQLDEVVAWIRSDGVGRSDEEVGQALRAELGLLRRGSRVDAVIRAAVRRSR